MSQQDPRDPNSLLDGVTLPPLYTTESDDDPMAQARLFVPGTIWNWYPIEGDGDTCYGLVVGMEAEYGEFTLSELAALEANGQGVQRDPTFTPMSARLIKRQHDDHDDAWWAVPERTPPPLPKDDSGILCFIVADGEDMDWDHIHNLFDDLFG